MTPAPAPVHAATAPDLKPGTYIHIRSGARYRHIGGAVLQDRTPVVLIRDEGDTVWVRPLDDFLKRFHRLGSCPPIDDGRCHAARDGDCFWKHCPQGRDGEPEKSGRHCPNDRLTIEDYGI